MWASDCQVYTDYLRLEHKQIHAVIGEIKKTVWDAANVHGNSQVAPKLGELRELLVRHFEQEEDGGCLEQAVSCCPRLSETVTQISGEHRTLLRQLDGLIDKVHDGLTAGAVNEFSQMLADFTKHLDAHDAAEDQVLQEAFGNG